MRYIHKSGTGRQSICHHGLLIDVVLRLIANQDSILGRSWIYVIQFSFVCDGGNLAGWQRAHSLLLFGRPIFLIPLFGRAFAVLFVGRQNKSLKSAAFTKVNRAQR